jgi:prevent-host-death family protein
MTARARTKAVTQVKRHATAIIAELKAHREPIEITENGRRSAVLLAVESFDELQRRLTVLEGIARGERALSERRVVAHEDVMRRLGRWRTGTSR